MFDDSIHSNIFWMHKDTLPAVRDLAKKHSATVQHRPFGRGKLNELSGKVTFTGHSWKARVEAKAAFWREVKANKLNIQS